jgi:hypothetical protein
MSLPTDRIQEFTREEQRAGVPSAIMSTWAKMPLYSTRWNMLHRPSVWASMEQGKGFRWGGLFGMSTLLAGGSTLSYRGKEQQGKKGSWLFPTRWVNEGVGYGLQRGGRALGRAASRSVMNASFQAQLAGMGMGVGHGVGLPLQGKTFWEALGGGVERFGTGMRSGGLGGGIAGLGGKAEGVGKAIQKIGGGGYYDNLWGYGKLNLGLDNNVIDRVIGSMSGLPADRLVMPTGMGEGAQTIWKAHLDRIISDKGISSIDAIHSRLPGLETSLQGTISKNTKVRDLFRFNDKTMDRIFTGMSTSDLTLVKAIEGQTGAISRASKFVAGAKLMKGVSVGANIALIGGLLATAGYKSITKATDAMIRLEQFNGFRSVETGNSAMPYLTAGSSTERSRALAAISNSRMNARSSLGMEGALAASYAQ